MYFLRLFSVCRSSSMWHVIIYVRNVIVPDHCPHQCPHLNPLLHGKLFQILICVVPQLPLCWGIQYSLYFEGIVVPLKTMWIAVHFYTF
ncbi:hypothetical protein XENTR_v10005760 [Xenopus tropicalis]|nr:hypothetical protein XENTR_v10005760 [Xenopus tropicalis]